MIDAKEHNIKYHIDPRFQFFAHPFSSLRLIDAFLLLSPRTPHGGRCIILDQEVTINYQDAMLFP
jgi:hypothetical protein